ncbi:MAG: type II restriction endonuclease [Caldilineaceae bacterium SB0661_bin_32]|uniref:Type II restriction endonuclease n=1 Tax=Caldilineaceae bacterium SB0661_bin_32 TaxID=2605255 RepID=A0A6B1D434_9CHLR|nr:SfiI family type II restriction endonuclease [Caldilineaceae bacterium]MYC94640.1 type II restriction endonuclease [Caldilineaceae bacterium SB0661_bin_32]
MLIDPYSLSSELEQLEQIEKASLRMIVQAIFDFRESAEEIFREESDLVADIGEDITREALDSMGMSRIDQRLFGKMDYKQARYLFHPEYAVRQALFVDSKAEKSSGMKTATLQTSQFSMEVRQIRSGQSLQIPGTLPSVLSLRDEDYITTTVFVKYNYSELTPKSYALDGVTIAALPNGLLQERYNPNAVDGIWLAGRNAPSRGEAFRVRLSFPKLKAKASWRVQSIPISAKIWHWTK